MLSEDFAENKNGILASSNLTSVNFTKTLFRELCPLNVPKRLNTIAHYTLHNQ